ncbi:MAG: FAD-dependent oxidoreductase [Chloroflexi bacterium]|nr:FAD-dependent oxidoreductase [Chloroflexota bacterium]
MARRDLRMASVERYRNLFTPVKIGNVEIRNRIAFTTACTEFVTPDGYSTEQYKAFWAARAKGGTGLLISGPFMPTKAQTASYATLACGLWDDSYCYGYAQVAEVCHYFGAKIFAQIGSGPGRQAYVKDPTRHPFAASAGTPYYITEDNLPESMKREFARRGLGLPLKVSLSGPLTQEAPREMIIAQEDACAEAAKRIVEMGYDGVEVHNAHGYFGFSFLSPRLNLRKDEYGGSLENRMRFFMNSLRKVRAAVPRDFVVGIRTSLEERMPGGLTRDEVKTICKTAEALGADYVCFSDGTWESFKYMLPSEPGLALEGVAEIKKELGIPVIAPSMDDPDMSEAALAQGKTDIIGFARGHFADPDWACKVARGERPNKCIRCGSCWVRLVNFHQTVRCVVNPGMGLEYHNPDYRMKPDRGLPPCNATCPLRQSTQGWVDLASQGRFEDAARLIREINPLPSVLGRVCPHPCETQCNRGEIEEPISIAAIERAVGDHGLAAPASAPKARREERVAVIGSGPAGLTAAYHLAGSGYPVTIFEALPVAGGMMAVGIPEYRLPRQVLQDEIDRVKQRGVEIKLESPLGPDLTVEDLKEQGYRAVFLAVGAHSGMKLNIPGEELDGVYHGAAFLKDVNLGKQVKVGSRVAVIGGGNVAVDAARTALRLGAGDVTIIYRRSAEEMPASADEVEEAHQEGVRISYLAAPARILGKNGKAAGLECMRMKLGEPDASGRRRPLPVAGSEFTVDADMVIAAIGETADLSFLPAGSALKADDGRIEVNPARMSTALPGVFAGGDAVRGPSWVVQAMADGRRAALAIDAYIRGESLPTEEKPLVNTIEVIGVGRPEHKARVKMAAAPVEERITSLKEVNLGLDDGETEEEAKRCLNCLWQVYMPLYRD